jgi:sulfate/thiosulfate transport system ATP-binding protein
VQVDVPETLYAKPADAFVHEFMGESVRLDCTVANGVARIAGLPGAEVPTDCADGRAIALIRPHEVALLPGPGSAQVRSAHVNGPMRRLGLTVADQAVEVLSPEDAWAPAVGDTCRIDVSKARIYPAG